MLHIRPAELRDAADIYHLNKASLGYDYDMGKTAMRLKYVLDEGRDKILVAETDGRVVGYIHAAAYECVYTDSQKDILALAVDSRFRKQGVGRALLNAVKEWAKQTGSAGVRLVSGHNRRDAHGFYTACGYENRKDQKNFTKFFK